MKKILLSSIFIALIASPVLANDATQDYNFGQNYSPPEYYQQNMIDNNIPPQNFSQLPPPTPQNITPKKKSWKFWENNNQSSGKHKGNFSYTPWQGNIQPQQNYNQLFQPAQSQFQPNYSAWQDDNNEPQGNTQYQTQSFQNPGYNNVQYLPQQPQPGFNGSQYPLPNLPPLNYNNPQY